MAVNVPANVIDASGPVRSAAVVGVVLAGGEGRRMGPGVPKPLRCLGGKTMVAHVVERLRPQVMDLVVVTNERAPAYRALNVPVVADPRDASAAARREGRRLGPLAGILAGMEWAVRHHPHAGWILTAPADMPFLPLDLTVRLCGHLHVPEPDVLTVWREPAVGIWSVKLVGDLRRALLTEWVRRVGEFAGRHHHAELRWPGGTAAFANVNTPEELTAAAARFARVRSQSRQSAAFRRSRN
jgi:molybdopterin-guanine dinucleotide biosynthesis protein A